MCYKYVRPYILVDPILMRTAREKVDSEGLPLIFPDELLQVIVHVDLVVFRHNQLHLFQKDMLPIQVRILSTHQIRLLRWVQILPPVFRASVENGQRR